MPLKGSFLRLLQVVAGIFGGLRQQGVYRWLGKRLVVNAG